jgi:hypothetical protein
MLQPLLLHPVTRMMRQMQRKAQRQGGMPLPSARQAQVFSRVGNPLPTSFAPRRDPDAHPPLPRAGQRPDGGTLRSLVPLRPGGHPPARLGRRAGTASPGQLLAGDAAPLSREQAQALAIDLSRRSTPAEGGFCTFQPVVDGGACPWNLDCHNCDKFVLSGADLLYWRRKREQWRLLAEGAPDDATATYLHDYFEPAARAIDGLEKALAGLGLLDDALALDLRKP